MGILDKIRGEDKGIPVNASFRITEQGRDKLQEFSGNATSRILVALETRGTSTINEISAASGVGRGQVERLVPKLITAGHVQYASSVTSDDI